MGTYDTFINYLVTFNKPLTLMNGDTISMQYNIIAEEVEHNKPLTKTKTVKEFHPFDDITILEAYLNQEKFWCDASLAYVEISSMSSAYALNCYRLLFRKEEEITIALSFTASKFPLPRIENFPLAIALRKQIKVAKETTYPWEVK